MCELTLSHKFSDYTDVPSAHWKGCPVAVKMMPIELAGSLRFIVQEASVAWMIHHPNVATVYGLTLELEDEKNKAWIVMELLQGSMDELFDASRLRGVEPLTFKEKVDLAHDSVCGLEHMHTRVSRFTAGEHTD